MIALGVESNLYGAESTFAPSIFQPEWPSTERTATVPDNAGAVLAPAGERGNPRCDRTRPLTRFSVLSESLRNALGVRLPVANCYWSREMSISQ